MYLNVSAPWELTFHAWYVYSFDGLSVTSITITYICQWHDKPITKSIAMADSSRTKDHQSWHFHSILVIAGLSLPSTSTANTIPACLWSLEITATIAVVHRRSPREGNGVWWPPSVERDFVLWALWNCWHDKSIKLIAPVKLKTVTVCLLITTFQILNPQVPALYICGILVDTLPADVLEHTERCKATSRHSAYTML